MIQKIIPDIKQGLCGPLPIGVGLILLTHVVPDTTLYGIGVALTYIGIQPFIPGGLKANP
jgi:hypothetical protein